MARSSLLASAGLPSRHPGCGSQEWSSSRQHTHPASQRGISDAPQPACGPNRRFACVSGRRRHRSAKRCSAALPAGSRLQASRRASERGSASLWLSGRSAWPTGCTRPGMVSALTDVPGRASMAAPAITGGGRGLKGTSGAPSPGHSVPDSRTNQQARDAQRGHCLHPPPQEPLYPAGRRQPWRGSGHAAAGLLQTHVRASQRLRPKGPPARQQGQRAVQVRQQGCKRCSAGNSRHARLNSRATSRGAAAPRTTSSNCSLAGACAARAYNM